MDEQRMRQMLAGEASKLASRIEADDEVGDRLGPKARTAIGSIGKAFGAKSARKKAVADLVKRQSGPLQFLMGPALEQAEKAVQVSASAGASPTLDEVQSTAQVASQKCAELETTVDAEWTVFELGLGEEEDAAGSAANSTLVMTLSPKPPAEIGRMYEALKVVGDKAKLGRFRTAAAFVLTERRSELGGVQRPTAEQSKELSTVKSLLAAFQMDRVGEARDGLIAARELVGLLRVVWSQGFKISGATASAATMFRLRTEDSGAALAEATATWGLDASWATR